MFPLTVWSEIRSCIKGSSHICKMTAATCFANNGPDMVVHAQPQFLSRVQYVEKLGRNESLVLDRDHREKIYDIFERYEQYKRKRGKWDYADRASTLLHRLLSLDPLSQHLFDKAYVDECQDHTQVEYAIVLVACGRHPESLFLAGDTAQSVAEVRYLKVCLLSYDKYTTAYALYFAVDLPPLTSI